MKANNEMYNSNTSPTLNKALWESPVEDLEQKINFLRQCGVSEENIAMIACANVQTVKSLTNILEDNLEDYIEWEEKTVSTEVIAIVNNELGKVAIQENLAKQNYVRKFRGVILSAANDEKYWEDENRSYGWLWNAA
jgi:dipeptidase